MSASIKHHVESGIPDEPHLQTSWTYKQQKSTDKPIGKSC